VEFGLWVVVVMMLFVGFIELVMMNYSYNLLADSAKGGVRYAIVHVIGSTNCSIPVDTTTTPATSCPDATGANVLSKVTRYALYSLHSTAGMGVNVTYPDTSSRPPSRVRVVVSYQYRPFFGLGWPSVIVRAAAEGRIMF